MVIAAAVAAVFVLIGIIGDISDGLESPSDDNATTTPQSSARAQPISTSNAPATSAVATAKAATPVPTTAATTTAARVADVQPTAVMPNVVCMDLEAAQDTIQAAGVFFSESVDATGQGRAQVWDRNWIVVDQTPAAGALIDEGDPVLSVVKEDEFSGC